MSVPYRRPGSELPSKLNPYAPPRPDTAPQPSAADRRGWRIYAYTITLLTVVSFLAELRKVNAIRLIDYGPGLLGLVGLLGYAHHRALLRRWVWMIHSLLLPLWDIALGAWVYPWFEPHSPPSSVLGYFTLMPIFFPEYLALIRYAYKSKDIWRLGSPK